VTVKAIDKINYTLSLRILYIKILKMARESGKNSGNFAFLTGLNEEKF